MCGIAGIVSKTPREFDYSTFCILGIANDSRGGDSCGVFIDGKYDYGTGKYKYFSDYFMQSDLLDKVDKAAVSFVHCRKASIGAISEKTAQPVIIKDKADKVVYVLMHNGTIHNYKDLAEKYIPEIDINGMTDSQVMAHIFFSKGYDVLNEYIGGAVFAIADYRYYSPKILLFKGASKETINSKEKTEERPLFYCIDKFKRELVFSSLPIELIALRRNCDVYSLKENTLAEFTGRELTVIKYYNRDECYQKEIKKSYVVHNYFELPYTNTYSNDFYISPDYNSNIYYYKNKKIDGLCFISEYGRLDHTKKNSPKNYEFYFFQGVPLKNQHCYRFLNNLKKETKLSDTDFFKKFENVIRYLSICQVYADEDKYYIATSPIDRVLFTGEIQGLGSILIRVYKDGIKTSQNYNGSYQFIVKLSNTNYDINFKSIREVCKSLMK